MPKCPRCGKEIDYLINVCEETAKYVFSPDEGEGLITTLTTHGQVTGAFSNAQNATRNFSLTKRMLKNF